MKKRRAPHRFRHVDGRVFALVACRDCGIERRFTFHGGGLLAALALYRAPGCAHWTTENPKCRRKSKRK